MNPLSEILNAIDDKYSGVLRDYVVQHIPLYVGQNFKLKSFNSEFDTPYPNEFFGPSLDGCINYAKEQLSSLPFQRYGNIISLGVPTLFSARSLGVSSICIGQVKFTFNETTSKIVLPNRNNRLVLPFEITYEQGYLGNAKYKCYEFKKGHLMNSKLEQ